MKIPSAAYFTAVKQGAATDDRWPIVHYLMFGLTIQVGADVLGTAVAPTVADLGALAGIVLIRAALSYFLSNDLERGLEETQEERRKDKTEL